MKQIKENVIERVTNQALKRQGLVPLFLFSEPRNIRPRDDYFTQQLEGIETL